MCACSLAPVSVSTHSVDLKKNSTVTPFFGFTHTAHLFPPRLFSASHTHTRARTHTHTHTHTLRIIRRQYGRYAFLSQVQSHVSETLFMNYETRSTFREALKHCLFSFSATIKGKFLQSVCDIILNVSISPSSAGGQTWCLL